MLHTLSLLIEEVIERPFQKAAGHGKDVSSALPYQAIVDLLKASLQHSAEHTSSNQDVAQYLRGQK